MAWPGLAVQQEQASDLAAERGQEPAVVAVEDWEKARASALEPEWGPEQVQAGAAEDFGRQPPLRW